MQIPTTAAPEGDRMIRSVAASLACILELDTREVPVPDVGHPEPWLVWRGWLATRGLGLAPIREPATFGWPGPWLALLRARDGQGMLGAVAFGSPPGIAWHPLGGHETFDAVEAGYLLAPADVALWSVRQPPAPRGTGTVEAILVAPRAASAMTRLDSVRAHAGRGLEGDRYFDGQGTFSSPHAHGHDLTLIEAEVLDELELRDEAIAPEEARRNIVTRGVDLNALVGRRFRIGDVECLGLRLCEPCAHLQRLTGRPGTLPALVHRGGLRADVLADGEIRRGAQITVG